MGMCSERLLVRFLLDTLNLLLLAWIILLGSLIDVGKRY